MVPLVEVDIALQVRDGDAVEIQVAPEHNSDFKQVLFRSTLCQKRVTPSTMSNIESDQCHMNNKIIR